MMVEKEKQLEYIEMWEKSGLSQLAFCKEMGLPYHSFLAWRKREDSNTGKQKIRRAEILPVKIIHNKEYEPYNSYVILNIKTYSLKIMPGFPSSEIKNIIDILES